MPRLSSPVFAIALPFIFLCTEWLSAQVYLEQLDYPANLNVPGVVPRYAVPGFQPSPMLNAGETLTWVQPLPIQVPISFPSYQVPRGNLAPNPMFLSPRPTDVLPLAIPNQPLIGQTNIVGIVEPDPGMMEVGRQQQTEIAAKTETRMQSPSADAIADSIVATQSQEPDAEAFKIAQEKAEKEAEQQRAVAAQVQSEIEVAVADIRTTFQARLKKLKDEGKLEKHPAIIHLRVTTRDQIQSVAKRIRAKYAGQRGQ